jgi:hypothetical protein
MPAPPLNREWVPSTLHNTNLHHSSRLDANTQDEQSVAPEVMRSRKVRVVGLWRRQHTLRNLCPRRERLFWRRRRLRLAAGQKRRETEGTCARRHGPNEKEISHSRVS